MPLHLLGKKSWNVYNQANIERVRQDEEKARLDARDAERKQRSDDVADRLRLLRGEENPTLQPASVPQGQKRKRTPQADLDDEDGPSRSLVSKASSVREKRTGRDEAYAQDVDLDRISNMRFKDAAGRNRDSQRPWYTTSSQSAEQVGRDVWGNEDTGRKVRDQARMDASDPLLAMKKGVKQLREVEKQKAEWREERERDLQGVEELARRERYDKKRHHRDRHRRDGDTDRERHRRRRRHRSRSRSRSPERFRRGS